ncbi:acyl-CoA thioesterase-1 [Peteryoungia aggregata LMG 23059]|uniref:Acyl-CoA thioesterase-1 n=1 Tax=Peteryoungia aggregata LMG 23059 TaxID=1368425 RepID=A0ABU0G6T2_9HYPH|nr:arylesterase [Peteryoungia aggregata]MDQ0420654.1 acyl-CoA thioesterase-1 [Peteryoungia aggregata LMG 23059]
MTFKASLLHFAVILVAALVGPRIAAADPLQLVGLGDSLMAGYQLPQEDALPAQLQRQLAAKGHDVVIANAGVSGDTTSGGLSRVDWSVPDGTDGVILELGANDALRGIPPEQTENNLEQIITRLKERNIPILLVGMLAPPNMGEDYGNKFNAIYPRLAEKHGLPLYPFVLDGVITDRSLLLEDGMHPNTKGLQIMAERMLPLAESWVAGIKGQPN